MAIRFRPELYQADDPALVEARQVARELLYGPLRRLARNGPAFDPLRAGVAAWSLAHGFAELWATGTLPPELGDDPERAARDVFAYLFRPVSPAGWG